MCVCLEGWGDEGVLITMVQQQHQQQRLHHCHACNRFDVVPLQMFPCTLMLSASRRAGRETEKEERERQKKQNTTIGISQPQPVSSHECGTDGALTRGDFFLFIIIFVVIIIIITPPTAVKSIFTVSGVINIPDSRTGNLTPPLIIMLALYSRHLMKDVVQLHPYNVELKQCSHMALFEKCIHRDHTFCSGGVSLIQGFDCSSKSL